MDKNNSDITIVQPNYDSVYSSVDTVNQQPIEYSVLNNDNNIVVIIVDDNNNQTTKSESVHQSKPIQSNDSSTPNKHSNCIVINGDIIKEYHEWRIVDKTNNYLYETGKLDKNGNRSGLSYVFLNGETQEMHIYEEDERVGNYLCFCDGLISEYDEEDNLVYEGEYDPIQFANFLRRGYGVLNKTDISLLEGDRENDLPNSKGNLYNEDGTTFKQGNWENGHNIDNTNYAFRKIRTVLNDELANFLYNILILMNIVSFPTLLFTNNLAVTFFTFY